MEGTKSTKAVAYALRFFYAWHRIELEQSERLRAALRLKCDQSGTAYQAKSTLEHSTFLHAHAQY